MIISKYFSSLCTNTGIFIKQKGLYKQQVLQKEQVSLSLT